MHRRLASLALVLLTAGLGIGTATLFANERVALGVLAALVLACLVGWGARAARERRPTDSAALPAGAPRPASAPPDGHVRFTSSWRAWTRTGSLRGGPTCVGRTARPRRSCGSCSGPSRWWRGGNSGSCGATQRRRPRCWCACWEPPRASRSGPPSNRLPSGRRRGAEARPPDPARPPTGPAAGDCRVRGSAAGAAAEVHISPLEEHIMRPLRYSINVTLDGCCDHRGIIADEELHRHHAKNLEQADALLFGRVTYEMMEAAWRPPATGVKPDWMADWMEPFARTIDAAKKYVVSSTLVRVDWNAELLRGDLVKAVQQLKRESGNGLFVGGVKLPQALAEVGLIDEYEFVVQPKLAGHGPTLFAGLSKYVDLKLVGRREFGSGAVVMRYEPRK